MANSKQPVLIDCLQEHDTFKGNGADAFWYVFRSTKPLNLTDERKSALAELIGDAINWRNGKENYDANKSIQP